MPEGGLRNRLIWKIKTTDAIDKRFLFHLLEADSEKIKSEGHGIAMMHATKGGMEVRMFPLPPLTTQQAIVAEIEAEQALVAANRELIERFEKKIQATLAQIWREDESPPTDLRCCHLLRHGVPGMPSAQPADDSGD